MVRSLGRLGGAVVRVTVQRASASELRLDHVFIAPEPHDQLQKLKGWGLATAVWD